MAVAELRRGGCSTGAALSPLPYTATTTLRSGSRFADHTPMSMLEQSAMVA